jgi:competence protein ComEA
VKAKEIVVLAGVAATLLLVNSVNLLKRGQMQKSAALVIERGPIRHSINHASAVELQELPGIGPALAERIVQYRQQYGGFNSLEELKRVKGIGEKTFVKIRAHIVL